MTGSGKIIEVQGTAEGDAFSRPELNRMLDTAASGIRKIVQMEKKILGKK